jgi:hypothetical protein
MSFFFLFSSFFYKIGEQEGRTGWREGSWYQWEKAGKESRKVNIVQNMCTHVCKCTSGR